MSSPPPENVQGDSATSNDTTADDFMSITVHHHGKPHILNLPSTSTLEDLSMAISETLSVPETSQKLLISPRPGMLKPPFPATALSNLYPPHAKTTPKITLYGSTVAEKTSFAEASSKESSTFAARQARLNARSTVSAYKSRPSASSLKYTFHKLVPLPHLPDPSRSLSFLQRLTNDPGIKRAMATHQFSVPILTEMDPAEHTTMESRTLGLNRNKGEVIELRLWTDDYKGMRDYRTVRKTLCHELAHCVHSEHDKHFWALTSKIEKEVEAADYSAGGRSIGGGGGEEFYNPGDWEGFVHGEGDHVDGGGWTGGSFVLGGAMGANASASDAGLSMREVMAKAAEERRKREQERGAGGKGKS